MSELEALVKEIARCTRCPLHRGRTKAVPGDGRTDARIVFIGEAPGFHEDQQGRPFVGAAGRFLEELLASIGVKREEVFITNVIKCRPPSNREPSPEEIEICRPFLDRQMELIQPYIVVTLGRYSMARAFPSARISQIHGKPRKIDGIIYYPMYHPAAALHQPSLRRTIEEDMQRIPELLGQVTLVDEAPPPVEAQQLTLF